MGAPSRLKGGTFQVPSALLFCLGFPKSLEKSHPLLIFPSTSCSILAYCPQFTLNSFSAPLSTLPQLPCHSFLLPNLAVFSWHAVLWYREQENTELGRMRCCRGCRKGKRKICCPEQLEETSRRVKECPPYLGMAGLGYKAEGEGNH